MPHSAASFSIPGSAAPSARLFVSEKAYAEDEDHRTAKKRRVSRNLGQSTFRENGCCTERVVHSSRQHVLGSGINPVGFAAAFMFAWSGHAAQRQGVIDLQTKTSTRDQATVDL